MVVQKEWLVILKMDQGHQNWEAWQRLECKISKISLHYYNIQDKANVKVSIMARNTLGMSLNLLPSYVNLSVYSLTLFLQCKSSIVAYPAQINFICREA